jgi:hypothetical protein
MPEIQLEYGDIAFMRELPRLLPRHLREASHPAKVTENNRIRRLQSRGLIRCTIDAEHSTAEFVMGELSLTDAGRAVLAAEK